MTVLLATCLSAVLFYLSQGVDNVWGLAWLAPVPLLWLAYGRAPLWQLIAASMVSILATMIYALWVYSTFPPALLVPLIALEAVLFPAAMVFTRLVQRRAPPLATLFAFPAAWTACEALIGVLSPHGSFGSLAYSQVSAPLLIQAASLLGLYAVTFLIGLFASSLAMALRPTRAAAAAIGLGLLICMADVLLGVVRLAQPQSPAIRVAALVDEDAMRQAGGAHTLPAEIAVARTYASEIRRASAQGASFVVTPEGGIAATAQWSSAVLAPLASAATDTHTHIIAGVLGRGPPGDYAFSFQPGGAVRRYSKRHLVPILEAQFKPGHQSGWLGQGRAMEICKDMDFPATIRHDAMRGVRLMGVPAWDFGGDAWIHARMAIMRGVENGFALVRAANDGMVTASDAEGRLVASKIVAPAGLTQIVADLPLGPGPTFYTRTGDFFVWLCGALVVAIGLYAFLHGKRPAVTSEAPARSSLKLSAKDPNTADAPLAPEPRSD